MTVLPRTPPEAPFVALFITDVLPGRREDFLAAMEKAMAESAHEPGVASFMLLCDREDPNRFIAVDVYRDLAGYQAHIAAPQTDWLVKALDGCLAGPPRATYHHRLADQHDFLGTDRPGG
jgi:quinol monooxygenase YgiN